MSGAAQEFYFRGQSSHKVIHPGDSASGAWNATHARALRLEERRRATRFIASQAGDAVDCAELLDALGLCAEDGFLVAPEDREEFERGESLGQGSGGLD